MHDIGTTSTFSISHIKTYSSILTQKGFKKVEHWLTICISWQSASLKTSVNKLSNHKTITSGTLSPVKTKVSAP